MHARFACIEVNTLTTSGLCVCSTSQTYPIHNTFYQYFTSRGFAILDVNCKKGPIRLEEMPCLFIRVLRRWRIVRVRSSIHSTSLREYSRVPKAASACWVTFSVDRTTGVLSMYMIPSMPSASSQKWARSTARRSASVEDRRAATPPLLASRIAASLAWESRSTGLPISSFW